MQALTAASGDQVAAMHAGLCCPQAGTIALGAWPPRQAIASIFHKRFQAFQLHHVHGAVTFLLSTLICGVAAKMMLVRSSRSVAACAARLTASSSASVRALHAQAGVSGSRADVAVCVSLSSPLNSSIVDSSLPSWWPASSIVRTPTSGTTAELPSVYDQRGVDAPEYLYDGEKEAVWCPETDATSEVGEISAMNRNMREPRKVRGW